MRTAALALIIVLAGCTAPVGQGSGSVPPTTEACFTDNVPDPDSLESAGNVTVQQYPDAPSSSNESAIAEFTMRFERAYLVNRLLETDREFDRIELQYWNSTVQRQSDGYVVSFDGGIATYYADGGHGDGHLSPEYVINETTARRSTEFGPDSWDGLVLNCTK